MKAIATQEQSDRLMALTKEAIDALIKTAKSDPIFEGVEDWSLYVGALKMATCTTIAVMIDEKVPIPVIKATFLGLVDFVAENLANEAREAEGN